MSPPCDTSRQRFECDHGSCSKSYLRLEHLTRHRLTHQDRAFTCFFCKKTFTRNDLLQVHLRRHSKRNVEESEGEGKISPQDQPSRPRRTTAGWDSAARPFAPPTGIDFGSTMLPESQSSSDFFTQEPSSPAAPAGFPLERVIFSTATGDATCVREVMQETPVLGPVERQLIGFFPRLSITDEYHQRLLAEIPGLEESDYRSKRTIETSVLAGIKYIGLYLTILHLPTFSISSNPIAVVLALWCLGGTLLSDVAAQQTAKTIYEHLREQLYCSAISAGPSTDWTTLQAMLILEHTGYYMRNDTADLTHGMLVNLARHNGFFNEATHVANDISGSAESQWQYWVDRESRLRLAYMIFISDITYAVPRMESPSLSTSAIDLPLPAPRVLWEANDASTWETELGKYGSAAVRGSLDTLKSAVASLLEQEPPRPSLEKALLDPLSLEVLVHCLGAEVMAFRHSLSSRAIEALRKSELESALDRWKVYFDRSVEVQKDIEMAISALHSYHLSHIFLDKDTFSSLQVNITSCRRDRTKGRSDETEATSPASVTSKEACIHAGNIVQLCLKQTRSLVTRPRYQVHVGYIASFVLLIHSTHIRLLGVVLQNPTSSAITPDDAFTLMQLMEYHNVQQDASEWRGNLAVGIHRSVQAMVDQLGTDHSPMAQRYCQTISNLLVAD